MKCVASKLPSVEKLQGTSGEDFSLSCQAKHHKSNELVILKSEIRFKK